MLLCCVIVMARTFFFGEAALTFSGFTSAAIATVPFGFVGFLAALSAIWAFFRRTGADRVVIWLRRFHQNEPSRFPLPRIFAMAGHSNFEVATIQDSRFQRSFATGMQSGAGCVFGLIIILIMPIILLSLIIAGLLAKAVGFLVSAGPIGQAAWFIAIYLVVYNAIVIPVSAMVIRRRGSVKLTDVRDIRKIARWIDKVKAGGGHFQPGLKIFRCADEFWMDAVELLVSRCDAAIIDISDMNENMRWELGQCAQKTSPYKLILAYGVAPELFPADPSDWLYDEITALVGNQIAQNVIWMPYPEPLPIKNGEAVLSDDLAGEALAHLQYAVNMALGRPVDPSAAGDPPGAIGPAVLFNDN